MSIRTWWSKRQFERRQVVLERDLFATLLERQSTFVQPSACCKTCGIPIAHMRYIQRAGDAPDPYCVRHTPRARTVATVTTMTVLR